MPVYAWLRDSDGQLFAQVYLVGAAWCAKAGALVPALKKRPTRGRADAHLTTLAKRLAHPLPGLTVVRMCAGSMPGRPARAPDVPVRGRIAAIRLVWLAASLGPR